jgi:hypothetical protein
LPDLVGYFSMFSPAISNPPSAIRISEIRLKAPNKLPLLAILNQAFKWPGLGQGPQTAHKPDIETTFGWPVSEAYR